MLMQLQEEVHLGPRRQLRSRHPSKGGLLQAGKPSS
jgi:hypothetical protein